MQIEPLATYYLLFLAETVTIVLAIVVIGLFISALSSQKEDKERLEIKKLNDKYNNMANTIKAHTLPKSQLKKDLKTQKRERKSAKKEAPDTPRKRTFVLNFDGDLKASSVNCLTEEITAVLTVADEQDEVFVRVYSAGGLVHAYGLAASQLQRIKKKGIPLTVSVDKVAASGGYMMACVADKIIASPFAIVGSIGVVAQIPNFHRLLQKHDVDFELLTAGKYKRTLTVFGENTDAAREKFRQDLEETHTLFQDFIAEHRANIDLDKVATGEYWHGKQALEMNLVDDLLTSDDYLLQASEERDLFEIDYTTKKPLSHKLSAFFSGAFERAYNRWQQRQQEDRLL